MDKRVLTVIIPVFNTEKYLQRCIDSIVCSKHINSLEIILVNDGSVDSSIEIMKEYAEKYSNTIHLIDKKNGGHGSAINRGIESATGKYVRILDSDDWFNTLHFDISVDFLKTTDVDLVLTGLSRVYAGDNKTKIESYKNYDIKFKKIYEFKSFDIDLLEDSIFRLPNITYKLSSYKKANFSLYENCFYVDLQYDLYPLPFIDTFVFLDCDVYRYFLGRPEQSISHESYVRNYNDHQRIVESLILFYEKQKGLLPEVKSQYIRKALMSMVYSHYLIGMKYDGNTRRGWQNTKAFDKRLKHISFEIYNKLGGKKDKNIIIKLNRATGFLMIRLKFITDITYFLFKKINGINGR